MQGRTRIRWDRLGRWALIGVFALVLYLYIGPAVSWIQTYREAGRQREARRLGMVKPGEQAYVVTGIK